jgi:4-oxalocrotonate tautomerase
MPFVTVKILEGRSPEQKKEIVKGVTKVVADACKTDQNAVHVFIEDLARDAYACGGILASDKK